jgi:hypothetical protein
MRALSDYEFVQFEADNAALLATMMPNAAKVVQWNGMSILVKIGPQPIVQDEELFQDVYLTDVSAAPQIQAISKDYPPPQSMLELLPQSTVDVIFEEAKAVGAALNAAGKAAGAAAAAAAKPLSDGITFGIVAVFAIAAFMYLPRRS